MLVAATRISGFFSKQTILILIGSLAPIILNVLGTLKIIPMTVYITPISFTIAFAPEVF